EPYIDEVDDLAPTAPLAMHEAPTVAAKRPAPAAEPAPPRRFWRASRVVLLSGALSAAAIVGVIKRERAVAGKSQGVVIPADEPRSAPPPAAPSSARPVALSPAPTAAPSAVPSAPTSSRAAAARSPSRAHAHSHVSTPRTRAAAPTLRNDRLFNPFG